MRVAGKAIVIAAVLAMAGVVAGPRLMTEAATGPVSALVLSDFGDVSATVARMQALGWTVTAKPTLEVMQSSATGPNPFRNYQVVWIPARSDASKLHFLLSAGERLETFLKAGGVVVMVELSPSGQWLCAIPGGAEALALPVGGAGAVTIAAANHALVTGEGIGGATISASDLDPGASGGLGYLAHLPADLPPVVVAQNASGPVLVEYGFSGGHVVVSLLANPDEAFENNLVRYAHALVP